ncbi:MAG: short-chain dehydrogenase [Candidatus Marinimicrobia bacterium]|nr:short-chain dehydrogenase [Candidatus Neomarinimicrobiota bacterium]MCF7828572.1 short-chain dehydrogenase [Candidatus Neomarinimicrobiota bacterium]MCF7880313.1 short-chain dehydrogenase [Candidatus Neomarinimicrobiota bacterium]
MDIRDKRILVLGGWGLVGRAISKRILARGPEQLIVTSLRKRETEEVVEALEPRAMKYGAEIVGEWGDIFVRDSMKDVGRGEMYTDQELRTTLIADIYDDLSEDVLTSSVLYQLVEKYQPHIIIDCINTATAFAYQNLFERVAQIRNSLKSTGRSIEDEEHILENVEQLIASQYIPQLIRHIQILHAAMWEFDTDSYLKIGTSGTGGMGLNVPFTHSEEKPSKLLLSKSSVAGAHTMLLFLMARTPGGPVVKEIKPSAAIAWKEIGYGKIRRHGSYIPMYDCKVEDAKRMDDYLERHPDKYWEEMEDKVVESVYIDAGENGYFSAGEFSVITSEGLMEFVTPEEIADKTLMEIEGGNTGKDVVAALDSAVLDPSYRAGVLREKAVNKMQHLEEEHETHSIAFELLGPPKITKLLYEIYLLKRITGDIKKIPDYDAESLSESMVGIIDSDDHLRQLILSVGTGILMPSGKDFLRGPDLSFPRFEGVNLYESTPEKVDFWADNGWLDLRVKNMEAWRDRITAILEEMGEDSEEDYSSEFYHRHKYEFDFGSSELGAIVSWILDKEEDGARIK